VVGSAWGIQSPVRTFSDMIYADVTLEPGAAIPIDAAHDSPLTNRTGAESMHVGVVQFET
jgi:redox-sensitive bicupin YhaK (pirin superfamily)